MSGLDLLGADDPRPSPGGRTPRESTSLTSSVVALAAGAAAALAARRSHPVLAFLGVAAAAGNAAAVARGERSIRDGARRVGRHAVAIVGSLAMPRYPIPGYIAGAFAGDLLFDGGDGVVEELARRAGVDLDRPIKPDRETTALARRDA
jgi:hypothetical protein